jgi:hypothetical protein
MQGQLARIRRSRLVLGTLALAWLPYVSARCVDASVHGCPTWGSSNEAGASSHHAGEGHHAHETAPPAEHGSNDDHTPARTCCELTGKYAFAPSTSAASAGPPMVLVTIRSATDAVRLLPPLSADARVPRTAHAPPRYLTFHTLLV